MADGTIAPVHPLCPQCDGIGQVARRLTRTTFFRYRPPPRLRIPCTGRLKRVPKLAWPKQPLACVGFSPNSTATLHFRKPDGTEYPTAPRAIDGNGTFSISYLAPTNKPPGTYTWWAVDGPTGRTSNTVSYTIR